MLRRLVAVAPARVGRALSTGARPNVTSPVRAVTPATAGVNSRRSYHEKDKSSPSSMSLSEEQRSIPIFADIEIHYLRTRS